MNHWRSAVAAIAAVVGSMALVGCASTATTSDRSVTIGDVVRVPVPAEFQMRAVTGMGGAGTEIRRYLRGRETGDLCTFRLAREASEEDPEVLAASLVDRRLAAAASSGVRDAVSGAEPAAPGRPGRRYVTASFSLHSTIYTDHSYWVWRAGPDLIVVSRSCQSSAGVEARQAVVDALPPVFLDIPDA